VAAAPGATPATPEELVDTIPGSMLGNYTKNGRIEFKDALNFQEITPGEQRVYMVRTRLSNRQASADSNIVAVRVYPVPDQVTDLRATLTEGSVLLAWSPPLFTPANGARSVEYRLYRADLPPGTTSGDSQAPVPPASAAPQMLAELVSTEFADMNAELGRRYVYFVRSVIRFNGESAESDDSNTALVEVKDVFPPAVPQGIVVVPSPADANLPASVEISWSFNAEEDLTGYRVYRGSEPSALVQVTTELLLTPTFRDSAVQRGQRYYYSVTASRDALARSALTDQKR
jgi:hypothetical protein